MFMEKDKKIQPGVGCLKFAGSFYEDLIESYRRFYNLV